MMPNLLTEGLPSSGGRKEAMMESQIVCCYTQNATGRCTA